MAMDSQPQTCVLIARYRAGEESALGRLFERYYDRIRRIVSVRAGPALLAGASLDDLVQDVFLRVVRNEARYEQRCDARWIDWVARVAQHELANGARRNRAVKRGAGMRRDNASGETLGHVAADTRGVLARISRQEEKGILDRCVAALPEPQREVVLWRDYAGADWATVAEQLGRPTPAACQELHRRARARLRQLLLQSGLGD